MYFFAFQQWLFYHFMIFQNDLRMLVWNYNVIFLLLFSLCLRPSEATAHQQVNQNGCEQKWLQIKYKRLNSFIVKSQAYNLYIDHKYVADLINNLESIVNQCDQFIRVDSREIIYHHFIQIIQQKYSQYQKNTIKTQIDSSTLKLEIDQSFYHQQLSFQRVKQEPQPEETELAMKFALVKSKGRPSKNKSEQLKLAEWLYSSHRVQFTKKQVDDKYGELIGSKKILTLKRLMLILKKFNLKKIVIRTKKNESYTIKTYFKIQFSGSMSHNSEEEILKKQEYVEAQLVTLQSSDQQNQSERDQIQNEAERSLDQIQIENQREEAKQQRKIDFFGRSFNDDLITDRVGVFFEESSYENDDN